MSVVYRCENSDKIGSYRAIKDSDYPAWMEDHNGSWDHPVPSEDGITNLPIQETKYRCGFSSIKQMHAWFKKSQRDELRSLGFAFLKLEVPGNAVYVGLHQVVFNRDLATLIEEIAE